MIDRYRMLYWWIISTYFHYELNENECQNNLDKTTLFYSFQIQTDTWILHNHGKKETNEDDNRQFCHCLRKDIT